jgi:hypothetical protein
MLWYIVMYYFQNENCLPPCPATGISFCNGIIQPVLAEGEEAPDSTPQFFRF